MESCNLLIGWGSRKVTPEKPVILQGQFHVRISERVNDPLCVAALALESEDHQTQCLMISVDTVSITKTLRDECRRQLRSRLRGFDVANLFLCATHTHTAPAQPGHLYPYQGPEVATDQEVLDQLVQGISNAAEEAWVQRKPGAVGWGQAQAVVGHNRRWTALDGASTMYGNPHADTFSHIEGYEDHTLELLFTYDAQRIPTGVVVNVACPSQVTEGASFVSADFWHETREVIRARLGQSMNILPQCSAAGDQSPHLLLNKAAEQRMMRLRGLGEEFDMAQRQVIGLRIADAVEGALIPVSKDIRDAVPFVHVTRAIDLPMRIVTEKDADQCRKQVERHRQAMADATDTQPASRSFSRDAMRAAYFQRVLDRFKTQGARPMLPVESHVIRLGDVVFATNRFELFLDFGMRIKARSNALQTFVVQLAGAGTYLPTARAVRGRSYGAGVESNLVGPEGGQVLVDQQVRTIHRLFDA